MEQLNEIALWSASQLIAELEASQVPKLDIPELDCFVRLIVPSMETMYGYRLQFVFQAGDNCPAEPSVLVSKNGKITSNNSRDDVVRKWLIDRLIDKAK